MSAHTPGPWWLSQMFIHRIAGNRTDGEGTFIADCDSKGSGDTQDAANARLMAAAPELLAELERQMDREYNPFEPDNQGAAYKRMKALHAKATGSEA